ncbi:MAG: hypothetical protein J6F30_02665 [Cellulosilyticum sp.]|nr:hypothetical protein [Cellulosilyticum sp.]
MKKGKNLLALVLCVAMCYVPMQAAGYYKTKNVLYGGVRLYYNGTYQNATSQAVLIDGTTYLPVRALGNMLGLSLDWNQNTSTVSIAGTTDTLLSAQAQLRAKDYQIAALTKELEQLKNQGVVSGVTSYNYDTTSGTDILGTEITATRKALDNEYGDYFDDIDFDFSLSLSSSKLRLTIEIDDSTDYREFNKLSRSEVKEFLEDVCDEVRDRHDKIAITGTIKYTGNNKTLYSFNYSKSDDLSYSTGSSSSSSYYDDDDLLDIVEETGYVKIEGYSSRIDVEKAKVRVNDDSERITFTLYLDIDDSDMKKAWNDNTGTNNDSTLKDYLKEIAEDLEDETDYDDIEGIIRDYDTDEQIGTYDYEDNELVLYKI